MTTVADLITYLSKFPKDTLVAVNKIITDSNIIDGYVSEVKPYILKTDQTQIIENGGLYQDGECITEEEQIDKEINDRLISQKNYNYRPAQIKVVKKILVLDA